MLLFFIRSDLRPSGSMTYFVFRVYNEMSSFVKQNKLRYIDVRNNS